MNSEAYEILQHTYGYQSFRGEQEQIIDAAIEGHDSLVLMPTGGGKSLCYQIPALVRPGIGLVVSPLIALMQDQVSALQVLGIRAAFLNSTLTPDEQRSVAAAMHQGEMDMIYIAPERLVQPGTLEWLRQFEISLIAIDEAHCVSQWGHDFRKDYLLLNQLKQSCPSVPRMALTATATTRTRTEIVHNLELTEPQIFVSGFDRPNIHYSVAPKNDAKKQLIRFLLPHKENSGIVYCLSRKKVESTAEWLCSRGLTALPYHAGLPASERAANQARFLREDAIIMVATIAFGMGIDKPDVRFVAHLDLPSSLEAYYQETGRAGRDGDPAQAWMVYGLNDVVQRSQFLEQSDASDLHKRNERAKLDSLLGWCEVTSCRRQALLQYFGEPLSEPCGNCDTCQNSPITWDATEAAQKLLSCVYRSGQRFGAGYVIDILRGKDDERIQQNGHETISTFGIGKDLSVAQWRSVIRQLIVRGLLLSDAEHFGALRLTEKSRDVLKGHAQLLLREETRQPRLTKTNSRSRFASGVSDSDHSLWDALRACRKALADEHNIAPYMVFHDATLMELMELRPDSETAMLNISGVGEAKLERFGKAFLDVIRKHS
ncbi:MAG: DNA helicase RecQ [Gammaproteobacteria bacterium]